MAQATANNSPHPTNSNSTSTSTTANTITNTNTTDHPPPFLLGRKDWRISSTSIDATEADPKQARGWCPPVIIGPPAITAEKKSFRKKLKDVSGSMGCNAM